MHFSVVLLSLLPTALAAPVADAPEKRSPQGLPIQAGSPQDTFGGVGQPNPFATDEQIQSHPAGFFSGQLGKRAAEKRSPQGLPIQAGSPEDTFGGVGQPNPFATDEQIQSHPAGATEKRDPQFFGGEGDFDQGFGEVFGG
ncbi:hypothetical protein ISF_07032 [Cordyceps fumosorosea ARSEF 2679]|uniref:Uncharacterized protein n=1 Tax=Cordyceps fumosorosea (strain ARSEF 2679) TaxID=1081104 RepID=A0A167QN45_CORFA|nr:hypothetical protein ISF_07032 [Cordyceps fumosorosea ARSEF 2679]OAA57791.1 hypothetical protein ISF_07032 [Cordyceps fumosorosea ARSEF 2679]